MHSKARRRARVAGPAAAVQGLSEDAAIGQDAVEKGMEEADLPAGVGRGLLALAWR